MNTAQLAIVVTGAVGALGILSPAVLGWVQRGHERNLARSARLHEQRLGVYRELGEFLETQRTLIERTEPLISYSGQRDAPPGPSDEEWAHVQGSVAVAGSQEVQTALIDFHVSVSAFAGHLFTYKQLQRQGEGQQVADAGMAMHEARKVVFGKLDEVEHVMRDELAQL